MNRLFCNLLRGGAGGPAIKRPAWLLVTLSLFPLSLLATIFGDVRGVVHDPDHQPVGGEFRKRLNS